METSHPKKRAKQTNARLGTDKLVDPSHPRVVALNFYFSTFL